MDKLSTLLLLLPIILSSTTVEFDYVINVDRPDHSDRDYNNFDVNYLENTSSEENYQEVIDHYQEILDTDVLGKTCFVKTKFH